MAITVTAIAASSSQLLALALALACSWGLTAKTTCTWVGVNRWGMRRELSIGQERELETLQCATLSLCVSVCAGQCMCLTSLTVPHRYDFDTPGPSLSQLPPLTPPEEEVQDVDVGMGDFGGHGPRAASSWGPHDWKPHSTSFLDELEAVGDAALDTDAWVRRGWWMGMNRGEGRREWCRGQ
jgi:hypothetical protein